MGNMKLDSFAEQKTRFLAFFMDTNRSSNHVMTWFVCFGAPTPACAQPAEEPGLAAFVLQ